MHIDEIREGISLNENEFIFNLDFQKQTNASSIIYKL